MYQKEIIYIGLYKDGSRIGNAGFLKIENREMESSFDLKLRNIPYNIRGKFPVRIYNGSNWKEINGIPVQEGNGSWKEEMTEPAESVQVQIMLPGGYFLEGKSKNAPETISWTKAESERKTEAEDNRAEKVNMGGENEENKPAEIPTDTQESMYGNMLRNIQEEQREEEKKPEDNTMNGDTRSVANRQDHEDGEPQTIIITEELQHSNVSTDYNRPDSSAEVPEAYSLKEDKWEQILDNYEKIHPYGDERVYVKLAPKDFIILQAKYQHLVNNSFLLHGFYNYRYVILGREKDYYLGVPGVFYEREKMVALMFGFEAFECPGGIAKAGEFGYYLRKVEL